MKPVNMMGSVNISKALWQRLRTTQGHLLLEMKKKAVKVTKKIHRINVYEEKQHAKPCQKP